MNTILPITTPLARPGNGNPGIVPPWITPTLPTPPDEIPHIWGLAPHYPTPTFPEPDSPHILGAVR